MVSQLIRTSVFSFDLTTFCVCLVGAKSLTSGVKSESGSGAPSPTGARSPPPSTPTPSRSGSLSTPAPSSSMLNNVQRTTKTDNVTIPSTYDKARDKCSEMIYDALAGDSGAREYCI